MDHPSRFGFSSCNVGDPIAEHPRGARVEVWSLQWSGAAGQRAVRCMGCRARLSKGMKVEAAGCDEIVVRLARRRLLLVPKRVQGLESDCVARNKRVVQLGGDGLNTCGTRIDWQRRHARAMTASSRSSRNRCFKLLQHPHLLRYSHSLHRNLIELAFEKRFFVILAFMSDISRGGMPCSV
jgi:hypothetical protein